MWVQEPSEGNFQTFLTGPVRLNVSCIITQDTHIENSYCAYMDVFPIQKRLHEIRLKLIVQWVLIFSVLPHSVSFF